MDEKRAILVVGPESSGTRLWTRILMAAGCAGDDGHEQRWDVALPEDESLIVWRRSVPHLGDWIGVEEMIRAVSDAEFEMQALVATRDWRSVIKSQVARGHVQDGKAAMAHMQRAYDVIFKDLSYWGVPCVIMSYESLAQRPQGVQQDLAARLGLPQVPAVDVYDGNEKYWEDVEGREQPMPTGDGRGGMNGSERLLLGCGEERREGWISLDYSRYAAADVVHDLNERPWPFEDGAFSEIEALDVLEHLDDVVGFMDECWRILQPGGKLTVRVPHYMDQNAWRDPTHKRAFHPDVFAYFDMRTQWGQRYGRLYTSRWWKMLEQKTVGGNITAVMEPMKDG